MLTSPPVERLARPRLPGWLRTRLPTADSFGLTRSLLEELKLHTKALGQFVADAYPQRRF